MLLIVAAGVLLSWDQAPAAGMPWGALAIIGACLCWGIDNNLTRKVSASDPLQIAGANAHEHEHAPLSHAHKHTHDEHHRHEHDFDWDGIEPHAHAHQHMPLRHSHPHYPDIHHRHGH